MKPIYFTDNVINKTLNNDKYEHVIEFAQNSVSIFDKETDEENNMIFHYHKNFRDFEYMTIALDDKTYFYIKEKGEPDYYFRDKNNNEVTIDKDTFEKVQKEFLKTL